MKKKTLHVVSHSHWDREWYMPFESHRYRLIEFFDRLLDTLDHDPSFKSFHLDGQAIVIEDYLEVRPQMREKIEKYIAEGRLVSGPWYILQDEYLTDGESNVRNMLIGRQVAAQYGKVSTVAYFPDAFGNIGQAPQILQGFGIDTVAFGRGTSPRKGDRLDTGEENYGKYVSEIKWRSPDGSEVLGSVFLRWYNNANEIPENTEEAAKRFAAIRDAAAEVSVTPHLLLMNGCDHQPVQVNIGQIIDRVNENFPDTIVHSNFHDYFEAIRPYADQFGIYVGELDGEYSDGWGTLANTASSRMYIKQLNAQCETMLEKRVEPLSVFSYLYADDPVRRDYFRFVWKHLLQNHPHDSICGCSVDGVHAEMVTRFNKVLVAGQEMEKSEKEAFMAKVDTASVGAAYVATVFNPNGILSSEAVTVYLDLPGDTAVTADQLTVMDGDKPLPCDVQDLGIVFDFILPKDAFRIPIHPHRFALTFRAEKVPALGYKSYAVKTDVQEKPATDLVLYKKAMANARLRVKFASDGSVTVIDRKSGAEHRTGIFVDTGDMGDEYMYHQSKDGVAVSTENSRAKVELVSASDAAITFRTVHAMKIPAGLDRTTGHRIGETVMKVETDYTLRSGADRLDVKTVIHNDAENHRLVVLTKTGIATDMLLAEGQFDMVQRPIQPWDGWKNPTKPGKMTNFFGLENDERGLLIAGRGLCEYEVLRDGENTMSLTLHRGVDQLGDWGYFPTPDAQCKGTLTVEYALVPFVQKKADRERAVNTAYLFAAGAPAAFCGKAHTGTCPACDALCEIAGSSCIVSAVKMAEDRDSVILRIFNPHTYDASMKLRLSDKFEAIYAVNLGEERQSKIIVRNGACTIPAASKKIVTVELVPSGK